MSVAAFAGLIFAYLLIGFILSVVFGSILDEEVTIIAVIMVAWPLYVFKVILSRLIKLPRMLPKAYRRLYGARRIFIGTDASLFTTAIRVWKRV